MREVRLTLTSGLALLAAMAGAGCVAPAPAPHVAACDEEIEALTFGARAGDAPSQYRLATRYYVSWLNPGLCATGAGPDDAIEAYRWYSLAAEQGIAAAAQRRELMAEAMTDGQLAEAKRRIAEWKGSGG